MHYCCKTTGTVCKLQSHAYSEESDKTFAECLHVDSSQSQSTLVKEWRYTVGLNVCSSDNYLPASSRPSNLF